MEITTYSDLININKACTDERWPITRETRIKATAALEKLVCDEQVEPQYKISALKTLAALDSLNLRDKEIDKRYAPKVVVTQKMTTSEIENRIKELEQGLGINQARLVMNEEVPIRSNSR